PQVAIGSRRLLLNAQRWKRNKGPVVSSRRSGDKVRVIGTLRETDRSRGLPGALPGYTCFRVTALPHIDQLGEIVSFVRIDGPVIAAFSVSQFVMAKFSFVCRKGWRCPRPHRRRRCIIAGNCDPDDHEKLCRYDERDL